MARILAVTQRTVCIQMVEIVMQTAVQTVVKTVAQIVAQTDAQVIAQIRQIVVA